jgi:hypothetical protein
MRPPLFERHLRPGGRPFNSRRAQVQTLLQHGHNIPHGLRGGGGERAWGTNERWHRNQLVRGGGWGGGDGGRVRGGCGEHGPGSRTGHGPSAGGAAAAGPAHAAAMRSDSAHRRSASASSSAYCDSSAPGWQRTASQWARQPAATTTQTKFKSSPLGRAHAARPQQKHALSVPVASDGNTGRIPHTQGNTLARTAHTQTVPASFLGRVGTGGAHQGCTEHALALTARGFAGAQST